MIRSIRLIVPITAVLAILTGMVGCTPPPQTAYPAAVDGWQNGLAFGSFSRLDHPAMQPDSQGWVTIWFDGPDLIFQRIRSENPQSPAQITTIGGTPWGPVLLPNTDGWVVLWRNQDRFGDPQLYSAVLEPDGTLRRGPTALTSEGVSAVEAAIGFQEEVIIIWADTAPRPTLYGQRLDAAGRPVGGSSTIIAYNAGQPALLRLADQWLLTWIALPDNPLAVSGTRMLRVRIASTAYPWGTPAQDSIIGEIDLTDPTHYVESITAGADSSHAYVFVSIRSATDRTVQTQLTTWPLSASPLDAAAVTVHKSIQLPVVPPGTDPDVLTTFNTGTAYSIPATGDPSGGIATAWPATLPVQTSTILPVAFATSGGIMLGYFQAGVLVGYQPISEAAYPIDHNQLQTDRERHLSLAWANVPRQTNTPANLVLMSTRPLPAELVR
jgi:hypothetical protein